MAEEKEPMQEFVVNLERIHQTVRVGEIRVVARNKRDASDQADYVVKRDRVQISWRKSQTSTIGTRVVDVRTLAEVQREQEEKDLDEEEDLDYEDYFEERPDEEDEEDEDDEMPPRNPGRRGDPCRPITRPKTRNSYPVTTKKRMKRRTKMARDDIMLGTLSLLAPKMYERIIKERQEAEKRHFQWLKEHTTPQDWDDFKTNFDKKLFLSAATWKPDLLFDVPALSERPGELVPPEKQHYVVRCPAAPERFCYCNQLVPAGIALDIAQGKRRGVVYFSDDVVTPCLFEKVAYETVTWMSETPMEMFTQRRGIRLARGRVVVGGLGLGWFLRKVCEKKAVTEVVVVEKEWALLDWLRPVLLAKHPFLAEKVKQWVCDDIYKFMEMDAANHERTKYLLDIWKTYGDCDGKFDQWKKKLDPNSIWGWGDISL